MSAAERSTPLDKSRSRRRLARELALKGVYQWLLTEHDLAAIEQQLAEEADFPHTDHLLMLELLRTAIRHADAFRAKLAPFSRRAIADLDPIEHAILLIAAAEFAGHPETNHRVIIDEAIELAKRYGADEGYKFVNGVLDRFAKRERAVEFTSRS